MTPSNRFPKAESERVEFKNSFSVAVIESLCAFANAKGGDVYVGIDDKGNAIGTSLAKESVVNWINEIRTKTIPSLIPDVRQIQKNKKDVVVFSVDEYPIKPVSILGRYYVRRGASNVQMTVSEVVTAHLKTFNSSWDFYQDTFHGLDDISLDKVQQSIELINRRTGRLQDAPLEFLRKEELIRDEGITNAAFLMFTKNDTCLTTIELGRFQTPTIIKDSDRTKSDIISQVEQVLDFIKKHINKEIIIHGEAENEQRWEYPLESLREIVLNMIIHRDYRSSSDSIVKIYDDRIEFYNPGNLPDEISIDDLMTNNYISRPRNKKIADFFKELGFIEKYGSGIQRVIRQCQRLGYPVPKFESLSGGVLVTVWGRKTKEKNSETKEKKSETKEKKSETKEKISETKEKKLESKEKKLESKEKTSAQILDTIQNNNKITVSELAELLSLTASGVEWNIRNLKRQGVLKRVGPDKGGHWEVVE